MAKRAYVLKRYRNPVTGESLDIHEHVFICLLKEGLWQQGICHTPEGFDVHHVDFDPSNNDPFNLALITREKHGKLHWEHDRETGSKRGKKVSQSLRKFWDSQPDGAGADKIKVAREAAMKKKISEGMTPAQLAGLEIARLARKNKFLKRLEERQAGMTEYEKASDDARREARNQSRKNWPSFNKK
jgi:hypothetical protein